MIALPIPFAAPVTIPILPSSLMVFSQLFQVRANRVDDHPRSARSRFPWPPAYALGNKNAHCFPPFAYQPMAFEDLFPYRQHQRYRALGLGEFLKSILRLARITEFDCPR